MQFEQFMQFVLLEHFGLFLALWVLFAVEEQVKLFVAKQVLLVFATFGCISGHSGFYLKEWSHKLCQP